MKTQEIADDMRKAWHEITPEQEYDAAVAYMEHQLSERTWDDSTDTVFPEDDEGFVSNYLKHVESIAAEWERYHQVEPVLTEADLSMTDIPWTDEYGFASVPVEQDLLDDMPELKKPSSWGWTLRKLIDARKVWLKALHTNDPEVICPDEDHYTNKERYTVKAVEAKVTMIEAKIKKMGADRRVLMF